MLETEFKALMRCGMYIDANLLEKGIYICEKPFIYSKNETIENMVKQGEQMKDMTEVSFISDKYFENLRQCDLVKIFLTLAIHNANDTLPHYFNPSENSSICKCGKYLTDEVHKRQL